MPMLSLAMLEKLTDAFSLLQDVMKAEELWQTNKNVY